jgi:hypothetical protein
MLLTALCLVLTEFDLSQGVISKHRLNLSWKERRMAGKTEKEEKKEIACFLCQKTEDQGVLLPCRKGGQELWVCTRCLPMLIHGG